MLKRGTNSANFVKIAQGIRPCGAFIFHILIKSQYKFGFWGPIPLSLYRWGWPIGAMCRPCGAKNLKIGVWVT